MKKILLVSLSLLSFNASATNFSVYDEYNHHYDELVQGPQGDAGADGINGSNGSNGIAGRDGIDGSLFNDNRLTQGMTAMAAMANIPALSHTSSGHGHSGLGVGVSNYSNQSGYALGLIHQIDNVSLKATVGASGSQSVYGAGASFSW